MTGIKNKSLSGLTWSFIDVFASQGISFIIGIFLARRLSPFDFGLVGMISIFIGISDTFINCGFSNALIRKNNCTDNDYTTVFCFNIIISLFFFSALFFLSPYVALYFNQNSLTDILRVSSIVLVIDAFSLVQRTILAKEINFKIQTKISLISSLTSGIIALLFVYKGFGVWSLVALRITNRFTATTLFWLMNKWKPKGRFSWTSFVTLFGFGSKLLLSGLLDTIYNNLNNLVIGKYFNAQSLGFYSKSQELANIPSQGLAGIVNRVAYPVLSSIQNDLDGMKMYYRQILRSSMFIISFIMILFAATAESFINLLLGDKWGDSILYLQMFCFVGVLYPLHLLSLSILQVFGRADLYLKIEIIKKILGIPLIFIGIYYGIKIMIIGMIISSIISYFINSHWSSRLINYSVLDQIRDILPSFILAMVVGVVIYFTGKLIAGTSLIKFIIQLMLGIVFSILILEKFKNKDYLILKKLFFANLFNK